jgi:hypothetical protein
VTLLSNIYFSVVRHIYYSAYTYLYKNHKQLLDNHFEQKGS